MAPRRPMTVPYPPTPSPPPLSVSPPPSDGGDARLLERRKIQHDIHHELATIMLLASVVGAAADVGPASRARAAHILGEARWLELLLRAYDETTHAEAPHADALHAEAPHADAPRAGTTQAGIPRWTPPADRVRVDTLVAETVEALRLTSTVRAQVTAEEAWAHANELTLWRAVRNVLDNAFRVAGPLGRVRVDVRVEVGWTAVRVDDDGPGFGTAKPGLASLGLGIVHDFVTSSGGALEAGAGELGGGCVRILLPAVPAPTGTGD